MSDTTKQWEYFRSGTVTEHTMSNDTGYRIRDGLTQWARPHDPWSQSQWSPGEIRKHCRPCATEQEALGQVPVPEKAEPAAEPAEKGEVRCWLYQGQPKWMGITCGSLAYFNNGNADSDGQPDEWCERRDPNTYITGDGYSEITKGMARKLLRERNWEMPECLREEEAMRFLVDDGTKDGNPAAFCDPDGGQRTLYDKLNPGWKDGYATYDGHLERETHNWQPATEPEFRKFLEARGWPLPGCMEEAVEYTYFLRDETSPPGVEGKTFGDHSGYGKWMLHRRTVQGVNEACNDRVRCWVDTTCDMDRPDSPFRPITPTEAAQLIAGEIEPAADTIEEEARVTGRRWWTGNRGLYCKKAGSKTHGYRDKNWTLRHSWNWGETHFAQNSVEISETAAISWMSEHGVEWPDGMGPKCWLHDNVTGYHREDSTRLTFVKKAHESNGGPLAQTGHMVEWGYALTSEPLARHHCGMAPLEPEATIEPKGFKVDDHVRVGGYGEPYDGVTGVVYKVDADDVYFDADEGQGWRKLGFHARNLTLISQETSMASFEIGDDVRVTGIDDAIGMGDDDIGRVGRITDIDLNSTDARYKVERIKPSETYLYGWTSESNMKHAETPATAEPNQAEQAHTTKGGKTMDTMNGYEKFGRAVTWVPRALFGSVKGKLIQDVNKKPTVIGGLLRLAVVGPLKFAARTYIYGTFGLCAIGEGFSPTNTVVAFYDTTTTLAGMAWNGVFG